MHVSIAAGGLFALVLTSIAHADQVILKNGDVLTGTVVAKRENTLTLNTSYAGDVNINWSDIRTLETGKPVAVLLSDESYRNARFETAETGKVQLTQAISTLDVDVTDSERYGLNEILYINPSPEESGKGYRIISRANLAFVQTNGNSTSDQLHVDGEAQLRAKTYRYTIGAEANRGSVNNVRSVSNSRLYTSYDSFFTPTKFVYVHGALENDRFKDINLRSVVGAGYGYQVYESETTRLSLKGGPDLVSVDRYISESERFAALGWHIDFSHKLQLIPAEAFHVQDGYRGFNSNGDILLKTRTGLRMPLSGGLTATAQLNFDWESNPAPGRENADRQLLFGLGYTFN